MTVRKTKTTKTGNLEAYLRSIDIQMDAENPGRFRHFMPTEKSVRLISSLLGEESDRAFIVVAPYGSGKSLAASYALHLIENRPESKGALRVIAKELIEVDSGLSQIASARVRKLNLRGLGIPLSGPVTDLHVAVRDGVFEALGRFKLGRETQSLRKIKVDRPEDLLPFLTQVQAKVQDLGFDRITILWDEFGKHLEFLVQEGRTSQLFHVQKLAEHIARAHMPFSFAVFLHMGLLHYAGSLSQSAHTEWRKIEGRFQTIDYIDDSKQLYSLLARLVKLKRTTNKEPAGYADDWTEFCQNNQLLPDFEVGELRSVIAASYPFTPPALYMLPRLTGRIAQNERTLFHFLEHWDGSSVVSPADLYDYFEPQMKADITTGGTHRQWLEAHSALQKVVDDNDSEAVLKTAMLFGLGMHGRAGSASLNLIRQAWREEIDGNTDSSGAVVNALIDRKLLLYRPYKDEVSVWHGSDMDLRSHLENEKTKRGPGFDLVSFLDKHAPPSYWRPLSYNTEYFLRRYFSSAFVSLSRYKEFLSTGFGLGERKGDGHIVFVLPESRDELREARKITLEIKDDLLVTAVPLEPVPLAAAALEIECLYKMQEDQDLVASDPLVLDEIRSLTSDAESYLNSLIRRCTTPGKTGPVWYQNGSEFKLESGEDLREMLSQICREIFSETPRLNNELINKSKPSAVVVNSRKKLMLGMLERDGTSDLGLPTTTPDGSMFRTLLVNTGVYKPVSGRAWGYANKSGGGIEDPGLKAVWCRIVSYVADSEDKPKPLEGLLRDLVSPPVGLRLGVIPIFLAAAIKAHGSATAIRRRGVLVEDLLPTVIEDMLKNPQGYTFEPIVLGGQAESIIRDFLRVFGEVGKKDIRGGDLARAGEFLIEWRHGLPRSAQTRVFEDPVLNDFRDAVFSTNDTVVFFSRVLPRLLKSYKVKVSGRRKLFWCWYEDLRTADSVYYAQIETGLRKHLELGPDGDMLITATTQSSMFSREFLSRLPNQKTRHFLQRLCMPYKTKSKLCRSVAQLLTEKRIQEFDDRVMESFLRELEQVDVDIDNTAARVDGEVFGDELKSWVVSKRRKRMAILHKDLIRLVGEAEADGFVQSLISKKARQAS